MCRHTKIYYYWKNYLQYADNYQSINQSAAFISGLERKTWIGKVNWIPFWPPESKCPVAVWPDITEWYIDWSCQRNTPVLNSHMILNAEWAIVAFNGFELTAPLKNCSNYLGVLEADTFKLWHQNQTVRTANFKFDWIHLLSKLQPGIIQNKEQLYIVGRWKCHRNPISNFYSSFLG